MIPAFLIKPLIGIGLAIALWLAFSGYTNKVYQDGYKEASDLYNRRELDASTAAKDAMEAAMLAAANKELKLRTQLQVIDQDRNREQQNANLTIEKLRADIASGTRRLSIPTTRANSQVPAAAPGGDTGIAAGLGKEERAELSIDASRFLVDQAASCDKTARQLNDVIDRYQMVQSLNAGTKALPSSPPAVNILPEVVQSPDHGGH